MPDAPPRFCPRCRALIRSKVCANCEKKRQTVLTQQRSDDPIRRLYGTERWRRMSKRHLALHPWCVGYPAGVHGNQPVVAQCTDHIVPAHEAPERFFDEENHQSFCNACNASKGRHENAGGLVNV